MFIKAFGKRVLSKFSSLLNATTSPGILLLLAPFFSKTEPYVCENVQKILVVDPYAIGDFVLSSPLLRELRVIFPSAKISVLLRHSANKQLAACCPYIDDVILRDPSPLKQGWPRWAWCLYCAKVALLELRRYRFDLAIYPYRGDDMYSAALLYFSGARYRFGWAQPEDLKTRRRDSADVLYTNLIHSSQLLHEVESKLEFIKALGGTPTSDALEIWTNDVDERFATNFLSLGKHQRPLIALGIGSARAKKQWTIEQYTELAKWLVGTLEANILLVGGAQDRGASNKIVQQLPGRVINMVGSTSIRQCAALIRRCALFVGNDSAPKHMAAAYFIPVVEISCEPQFDRAGAQLNSKINTRFRPWKTRHALVQPTHAAAGCDTSCESEQPHCIAQVSLDAVKDAVIRMLAGETGGSEPVQAATLLPNSVATSR